MKIPMETEQASMKSQMALQQAVIDHLQTMNDHMQSMGMSGWNYGWMWICGLVLIVAIVLLLRARK
jgi:hypothetical protein